MAVVEDGVEDDEELADAVVVLAALVLDALSISSHLHVNGEMVRSETVRHACGQARARAGAHTL